MEAKIEALLRINGGDAVDPLIKRLDEHFERHEGVHPHSHDEEFVQTAGMEVRQVAAR